MRENERELKNVREWERMRENDREWKRMRESETDWERMKENEWECQRMRENERGWERMRENDRDWESTAAQIRAHSRESAYPHRKRSAQAASTRACLGFLAPSIVLKRTLADGVANERTRVLGLVRLAYDIELGHYGLNLTTQWVLADYNLISSTCIFLNDIFCVKWSDHKGEFSRCAWYL